MQRREVIHSLVLAVCGVLLFGAPLVLGGYGLTVLTEIVIFALFAMSTNLLLGYTGLASLGQSAFFGMGGYCVAILAKDFNLHSAATLLAAIGAGAVLALGTGPVVLRSSGTYFLMLTLALTQVLFGVAWFLPGLTGGDNGLGGIARPTLPWVGDVLRGATAFYYFSLVCVGIGVAILAWLVNSGFGLALQGILENELVAAGLGYPVWWLKYLAYIVAGALSALAGGLYTFLTSFVGTSYFGIALSTEVLVMVILGGSRSFWGPAIGAGLVILLRDEVSSWTQRWLLVLGLLFVVTVLFLPGGIATLPERLSQVRRKQRGQQPLVSVAKSLTPVQSVESATSHQERVP